MKVTNELIKEVYEINYQRNGVSGVGFYVLSFLSSDDERLIALFNTQYDKDGLASVDVIQTRVINPEEFSNCYRGDNFGSAIQDLIEKEPKFNQYLKSAELFYIFS